MPYVRPSYIFALTLYSAACGRSHRTAQQEIDQVATLNIALLDFCVGFGEVRRQDF